MSVRSFSKRVSARPLRWGMLPLFGLLFATGAAHELATRTPDAPPMPVTDAKDEGTLPAAPGPARVQRAKRQTLNPTMLDKMDKSPFFSLAAETPEIDPCLHADGARHVGPGTVVNPHDTSNPCMTGDLSPAPALLASLPQAAVFGPVVSTGSDSFSSGAGGDGATGATRRSDFSGDEFVTLLIGGMPMSFVFAPTGPGLNTPGPQLLPGTPGTPPAANPIPLDPAPVPLPLPAVLFGLGIAMLAPLRRHSQR